MALDTDISLTDIDEVLSFLGADAKKDGIWVYWSLDDADAATVEVTDTTLVLKVTVGTAHRAATGTVATIGTDAAHGLVVGSSVVISDMGDATYDGTHIVTVVDDTTHFSFDLIHAAEAETIDTAGTIVGTNTLTFADADKDIISELITVINALTGWKSGRICHGDADSTDLVVTGALDADGTENEQVLKIVDHYLLIELINRASDLINRYCNRTLKTTEYLLKRYNGEGAKLLLENYPVTDVIQICDGITNAIRVKCTDDTVYNAYVEVDQSAETLKLIRGDAEDASFDLSHADYDTLGELATAINDMANWESEIANSDYSSYPSSQVFTKYNYYCKNQSIYLEIPNEPLDNYDMDYDAGIINLSSEFSRGFQNIYVSYTAGYITIPDALEQACIELVAYKYGKSKRADSGDLQSETFGEGADYKYVKFNLADIKNILPDSLLAALDLFKKRSF